MKIEIIPHKDKNGLYAIKIIDEIDEDKKVKSFSEIFKILSKSVVVYREK